MTLTPTAESLGVTSDQLAAARAHLADGSAAWIVVSGKMASGKDSVAPLLLPALGYTRTARVGYSDPMKEQLQVAYDLIRADAGSATAALADALGLAPEHAGELVDLVAGSAADPSCSAWDRTDVNRRALQQLGSTWRADDGEDYWSKMVTGMCLAHLAHGTSVYLTGGRFVPDVALPARFGAVTVRLDVTRATQLSRLGSRDGLQHVDTSVLDHPGETAVDGFPFDIRVSNDGVFEDTVAQLTVALSRILSSRRSA